MDRGDFVCPHGFRVRFYDDKLLYKVHSAIPYKSSLPNHLVYNIMCSPYRVDIWLTNDDVVSRLNIHSWREYQHYSKQCSVEEIVCGTLSQIGKIVVLDDSSSQLALF